MTSPPYNIVFIPSVLVMNGGREVVGGVVTEYRRSRYRWLRETRRVDSEERFRDAGALRERLTEIRHGLVIEAPPAIHVRVPIFRRL